MPMFNQAPVSGYLTAPPTLVKSNRAAPAFSLSAGSLVVGQNITVIVPGGVQSFLANAAIPAPSYTTGTDYVVTCNGTALAVEPYRHGSDVVGGFHNSIANGINQFSIWDINYRPAATEPRGMALVAGAYFWADIYFLGVNHHTDGTSRAGATIADGLSLPKIPLIYGGNGVSTYSALDWYAATEVLAAYGKRSPDVHEFALLASGTTEQSAVVSDQVTTKSNPAYRSRWGIEQATGVQWVWSRLIDVQPDGTLTWKATTGGKGSIFAASVGARFLGGSWDSGANAGSMAAICNPSPTQSAGGITARGVCGHYQI